MNFEIMVPVLVGLVSAFGSGGAVSLLLRFKGKREDRVAAETSVLAGPFKDLLDDTKKLNERLDASEKEVFQLRGDVERCHTDREKERRDHTDCRAKVAGLEHRVGELNGELHTTRAQFFEAVAVLAGEFDRSVSGRKRNVRGRVEQLISEQKIPLQPTDLPRDTLPPDDDE